MTGSIRPGRLLALLGVTIALLVAASLPERAAAHPLGNFTINQYSRIEATTGGFRLTYVLDMAEIPTFQEIQQRIDTNGDGTISDAERAAYLTAKLAEIAPNLHLAIDGTDVVLQPASRELTFPDGQAGLKLLRLRAVFSAPLGAAAGAAHALTYHNDFAADRIGWKEIIVTHGAGIALDSSNVLATDSSKELRAYPQDMLSSPLNQTSAAFSLAISPGAPAASGFDTFATGANAAGETGNVARPGGGATGARFASLVNGRDLTTTGIVVALLAAMLWGAMHALSPGHGKTIVGAYLVGSRGTPRHAVFLGLTVTITHTAGVLALGMITLFASHYILPERLFPWLSVGSGVLVIGMGLFIFRQRLRGQPGFGHHHHDHDHDHDHHHDHEHEFAHAHGLVHSHGGHTHSHLPPGADGGRITWRALLALGVSGGLIPCPSALVVLLGSLALGRVGFGLALVLAFSVGLAATLTGVGLLFLYASRYLARRAQPGARMQMVLRYAPAFGALALTLAGVAIVIRALEATSLR